MSVNTYLTPEELPRLERAVVGIAGACAAVKLASGPEQLLLFTGAAAVLALTGVAIQIRK